MAGGRFAYMALRERQIDYTHLFGFVKHNLFARGGDDSISVEGCPCLRRRAYMVLSLRNTGVATGATHEKRTIT